MKRPRRNAAAIEPASSFVPGPQLRALAHVQLAARKPVKIAAISIARSRPLSRRAMMFRTSDGVGMFTPISRRRFVRASSRLFLWERRLRTTFCVTSPRSSSESDTRILRTMAGERSCRNLVELAHERDGERRDGRASHRCDVVVEVLSVVYQAIGVYMPAIAGTRTPRKRPSGAECKGRARRGCARGQSCAGPRGVAPQGRARIFSPL